MTSCVGYSYGRICYLYPSYKRQCPPRWKESSHGHVALTGNDLVDEGVGGARYCKVKQGTLQQNFWKGIHYNVRIITFLLKCTCTVHS